MSLLNPEPPATPERSPVALVVVSLVVGIALGGLGVWGVFRSLETPTAQSTPAPKPIVIEKPAAPAAPPPIPETGDVEIEAAIVYKVGGAQPVARASFHLLDASFDSVVRESGAGLAIESMGAVDSYAFAARHPESHPGYAETVEAALRRHVKYTTKTDFQGKARFEKIRPGRYWLFGITETRGGHAGWNLPVTVEPGTQRLILDGDNAATAF